MNARALSLALLVLGGCTTGSIGDGKGGDGTGDSPSGNGSGTGGTSTGAGLVTPGSNEDIRARLEPTCGGCHAAGSNKPIFASAKSFADLLAYNPTYVTPHHPEESELIALLDGRGTQRFKQMPLTGDPFDARSARGETKITTQQVKDWISNLAPRNRVIAGRDPSAVTVRRMTAEQVTDNLYDQLGIREVPDFGANRNWNGGDRLPVRSDDGYDNYDYHSFAYAAEHFGALGGPAWLARVPRSNELSPSFFQALTQVSQAWCRLSITKTGTPLLKYATLGDKSPSGNAAIQKNIAYLYKRMLGQVPTAADAGALFDGVYLKYEPKDTATAWVAVCSSLIRHPLWLSY